MQDELADYYDLTASSIRIRTNSFPGSKDIVCINFRDSSLVFMNQGFQLCIYFEETISVLTLDRKKRCANSKTSLESYPDTQDKTWQIFKTLSLFNIHCNGREALILKFKDLDCGDNLLKLDFGWITFSYELKGGSTAHIMPFKLPGTFQLKFCK